MAQTRISLLLAGVAVFLGLSGTAHADVLGDVHSFQIDSSYDAWGATSMTATLRQVGQNAYFYVDDRYWATLSSSQQQQYTTALAGLSGEFDSVIYPKATSFWGSENKPGVDGDPHVTILLEHLGSNSGGYFETINGYTQQQAPTSNAREMVYVSADSVMSDGAKNFVAHEFQHLISFNQKELLQRIVDDTWLNEARSEYDITVAGYDDPFSGSTLQRREQIFLQNPSDSLVDWPNTATDYAIATIFAHYLADRFGPALMASTIHSHDNGVVAINDWLAQNGQAERFPDVFTDWMIASYANDPILGSQYAYSRPGLADLHVAPQYTSTMGDQSQYAISAGLKAWQPLWVRLDIIPGVQSSALNVQFTGPTGAWSGGAAYALYDDGSRSVIPLAGNQGQSTASIPVILPLGNHPHLRSVGLAVTQGTQVAVGDSQIPTLPVTVTATFGASASVPSGTPIPTPVPTAQVNNGDLIHHDAEAETYVVWGTYRRYLPQGVLALYGFQNRPIISVDNNTFTRYTTSNYVRAVDDTKVYALWPDGTKHWLNITPAQWDASGRDWNAIFIVNDAEVNFYKTGGEITQ